MIYKELTELDIAQDLVRDDYSDFSYHGARVLAEYLIDLSDDIGDIEFDPVSIRCEWSEAHLEEILEQHKDINTLEALEDATTVLKVEGKHISTSYVWMEF